MPHWNDTLGKYDDIAPNPPHYPKGPTPMTAPSYEAILLSLLPSMKELIPLASTSQMASYLGDTADDELSLPKAVALSHAYAAKVICNLTTAIKREADDACKAH